MESDEGVLNELWAKLIIKELIHQGVRSFFISPGSRSTPLILAASQHPLAKTVVHFDERGMAFQALGYAKGSGTVAALIVTSGTAVGNLLPAIMEAHHANIPLILLTADRPPEQRHAGANQTTEQFNIYANFVRHQVDLPCPNSTISPRFIGTTIAQVVGFAKGEPPGPVHLNCMVRDPLFQTEGSPPPFFHDSLGAQTVLSSGKMTLSEEAIEQIAEELSEHEKGVILVGAMQPWPTLEPLLILSRLLQWPLFPDLLSQIRNLGKISGVIQSFDLILKIIKQDPQFAPDAILQFGEGFISKQLLKYLSYKSPHMYIHVTPSLKRKDPLHLITHRIQSDPFQFAKGLEEKLSGRPPAPWLTRWNTLNTQVEADVYHYFKQKKTMTEPELFHALPFFLPQNRALFISNSMPIRNADTFFFSQDKLQPFFGNRGLSGIDGNIATAIGLSQGVEKPLLAILGDLAFLHDLNSLAQLKEAPFSVIFLLINNRGGSIFSLLPISKKKEVFEPFFLTPHSFSFKHIASFFGLTYASPQSLYELKTLLHAPSAKFSLIEVQTSWEKNTLIYQNTLTYLKTRHKSLALIPSSEETS